MTSADARAVQVEPDEPVFHAAWERKARALVYAAMGTHPNPTRSAFRHSIERMDPEHYVTSSYYEHWLTAAASVAVESGTIEREELESRAGGAFPLSRRPYWESWTVALEDLLVTTALLSAEDLDQVPARLPLTRGRSPSSRDDDPMQPPHRVSHLATGDPDTHRLARTRAWARAAVRRLPTCWAASSSAQRSTAPATAGEVAGAAPSSSSSCTHWWWQCGRRESS